YTRPGSSTVVTRERHPDLRRRMFACRCTSAMTRAGRPGHTSYRCKASETVTLVPACTDPSPTVTWAVSHDRRVRRGDAFGGGRPRAGPARTATSVWSDGGARPPAEVCHHRDELDRSLGAPRLPSRPASARINDPRRGSMPDHAPVCVLTHYP